MKVYSRNSDGTRGAMLRRTLTKYDQTSVSVPPRLGLPGEETETAYRNVRAIKEVNLLLDTGGYALAKASTYTFDPTYQATTGLDLLTTTESIFAEVDPSMAQTAPIDTISPGTGTIVRSAETTYLNESAYRDRNIVGLATSSLLKDGHGNVVARSENIYDESAYPLLTYSDLIEVADYTNPNTNARGNVTTTRRYYDIGNSLYLENHAQFDQCGNVRNVWNDRNIQSQTEYSSTYKHAFPTQSTTAIPVPDTSETHGSHSAFVSTCTYDYTTGTIVSTTDVNGQATTYSYANDQGQLDSMNRLRKVTRPDGGWTRTTYNDEIGNLFVYNETKQDATRVAKAYQYFDAMGRTIRACTLDAGSSYIIADSQYDMLGRISRVSNPYRGELGSSINPSNRWTNTVYDALSRPKAVTFSDGTSSWTIQTDYQGVYTTVTDQALRKRRQKVDSLGRIVRVDEPDSSGNLGSLGSPSQPTLYEYDTQGNLTHVTLGGNSGPLQHRYFKYDALSRLLFERLVEQSAIFSASDSVTGNGQWSRKIIYDETIGGVSYKGLMTSMWDARNIRTQFKYDQLNRVWQMTYDDGTPTVTSNYDQERTGYFNRAKLTEVTTASVGVIPQTSQAHDYDLVSRVVKQTQTVGENSYTLRYTFNVGGQLTQEIYPSGRVVNFGYDEASRLSTVNGGQGHTYISGMAYMPQGALMSATLGNNATYNYTYNSRSQLSILEASRNSVVLQRYEYKYGAASLGSESVDETKNTGQVGRIESWIGTQKQWQQRFVYDSLGRLLTSAEYRGDNSQQSYQLNFSYDVFANRYQYQSLNSGNPSSLNQKWVESSDIDKATNRFTSNVTYDAAGNVTADPRFRNLQYQYDANGRMKQSASSSGTNQVTAVYDGVGQRVATVFNGVLSIMVYDSMHKLVAEYGQTAPATADIQYLLSDHQGSTRITTNRAGQVVSRHDYQPFGEEIGADIGTRDVSTKHFTAGDNARQKYAGMESDDATNLAHTLWRKYDAQSGTWTTPDPYGGSMTVADPQSFNRYAYVNNDPSNQVDPLGLMSGANASQSWGDVAGSFWPAGFDFNESHSIGRHIINDREAEVDERAVRAFKDSADKRNANKAIREGNYALALAILKDNENLALESETTDVTVNVSEDIDSSESLASESSTAGGPVPSQHEPTAGPFIVENPDSWIGMNKLGDGDCVALPQMVAQLPNTRMWREGPKVFGNKSIKRGTVIATFVNGRYPRQPTGVHAGIYLSQDANGIWVVDQYHATRAIQIRYIRLKPEGTDLSNNARAFSVVRVRIPHPISGM